jgi:formate dehydrogenase accessory protein FdhE
MRDDPSDLHRPAASARPAPADLILDSVERDHPEWSRWLRLARLAVAELASPWPVELKLPARRPDGAPLLHGATIGVAESRVRHWLSRLFAAASEDLFGAETLQAEPLKLLEAAFRLDEQAIEDISLSARLDPAVAGSVAQFAVMPILHSCRQRVKHRIPADWSQGYCPVCAAWPALSEMRGLDRERRMRCGRCGCDWRLDVLVCPFCGERDHHQLGALSVEGEDETPKADTCRSCMSYLKSVTTLLALPDSMVVAEDARTLHLDLVVTERGFSRPGRGSFETVVHLVGARE